MVTVPPRDADVAVLDLRSADLRAATVDLAGCPGLPCDLVCQNCGAAKKCSLDARNAVACMSSGGVLPGHACSFGSGDDCGAGAICLVAGGSGAGACFRYCRIDGDCPGGGTCTISVQGSSARVCTDPVTGCAILPAMSGCGAGTTCFPVSAQGQTGCHLGGAGTTGSACVDSYDCQAGYACFQTPTGCQKLCRIANGSDCPQGKACTAVPGWTSGYGVCT